MNSTEEHLPLFSTEHAAELPEQDLAADPAEAATSYHDPEDALAHLDPDELYETGVISGGERSWVLDGAGVQLSEEGSSEIQITDTRKRPEEKLELTPEQDDEIEYLVERRNFSYGEARAAVLGR